MDAITDKSQPSLLAASKNVRLLNAGLLERPSGEVVAHGWLDIPSIRALGVAPYQREVLGATSGKRTSPIRRALANGASLPDIMVGMRGDNYDVKGGAMILLDKCFVVDGLQRISQMLFHAELNPEEAKSLLIGAEVRFNTTEASEKDLFLVLNTSRVPVSPNVILRNLRDKHHAILTLYGLTHTDSKFALYDRVSWEQRMAKAEVLTALMLAKTAKAMHSIGTFASGGTERAESIANVLDTITKRVGMANFRKNVVHFFDVVDECFGLRTIKYKELAPQLKGNFLVTLGRVFAAHSNFWDEENKELFVDAPNRNKLALFPIDDPEVIRLAGAGNMAQPILYTMLVDHMNKGKRTNQLKRRG